MTGQYVFVCGKGAVSHPATASIELGSGAGAPSNGSLADKHLVLADCRSEATPDIVGWTKIALAAGKPMMLLAPSLETIEALKDIVGVLPALASAALLIRAESNSAGLSDCDIWSLADDPSPERGDEGDAPIKNAREKDTSAPAGVPTADAAPSGLAGGQAASAFAAQVLEVMDPGYRRMQLDIQPPAGLKYTLNTTTLYSNFTYSDDGYTNGPGLVTYVWTIWAFLGQSATANTQYLVVNGNLTLNAGTLYGNTDSSRGFGNDYLQGTLTAPMSPSSFVPTSGDGSFSGTVSIPISYSSPTGGYQIWTFSDSVSFSVSSWSCNSISSGAAQGAMFWMTSPCDGSNISGTWKDAFDIWGNIAALTPASSGTLSVNTISAWYTNSMLNGSQLVSAVFSWKGTYFWSSTLQMHYKSITFTGYPSFYVSFSSLQP
jgi:hypothetical protein